MREQHADTHGNAVLVQHAFGRQHFQTVLDLLCGVVRVEQTNHLAADKAWVRVSRQRHLPGAFADFYRTLGQNGVVIARADLKNCAQTAFTDGSVCPPIRRVRNIHRASGCMQIAIPSVVLQRRVAGLLFILTWPVINHKANQCVMRDQGCGIRGGRKGNPA